MTASEARRPTIREDWEKFVLGLPCWVAHSWSSWADCDEYRYITVYQQRTCSKCGERRRRYCG